MSYFICGILCLIAFILQDSILIKTSTVILFFILAWVKRGKIKILPSLFILLSVMIFALFSPVGKVLFRIGSFPITLGALEVGFRKGIVLIGMVFISQFAISKEISLPGKMGSLISGMFYWFNALGGTAFKVEKKGIIKSIDERLVSVYFENNLEGLQEAVVGKSNNQDDRRFVSQKKPNSSSIRTTIWLIILTCVIYGLLFV